MKSETWTWEAVACFHKSVAYPEAGSHRRAEKKEAKGKTQDFLKSHPPLTCCVTLDKRHTISDPISVRVH